MFPALLITTSILDPVAARILGAARRTESWSDKSIWTNVALTDGPIPRIAERTGSTLAVVQDAMRMCAGEALASSVAIELPILGWPAPVMTKTRPLTCGAKAASTCSLVTVASKTGMVTEIIEVLGFGKRLRFLR